MAASHNRVLEYRSCSIHKAACLNSCSQGLQAWTNSGEHLALSRLWNLKEVGSNISEVMTQEQDR